MSIRIVQVRKKKCAFLPLLLLADEQEDMIARYLNRGALFALYDGGLRAVCVVTEEGDGVFEVKNLAVVPEHQHRGYGRAMLRFVRERYRGGRLLLVGTGESPRTVPFYQRCGFTFSHRVKNFFLEHYDHPIIEDGVLLQDMVYFQCRLGETVDAAEEQF